MRKTVESGVRFLDWFIKEQGEEEKNAEDLLKKMEVFLSEERKANTAAYIKSLNPP